MDQKVKWGVLGYARIARTSVIPAILKASNSEFYTIASRDQEKTEQCRKEFGCQKAYASYEALLDDPEIQAVYIPLPNALHREWAIKAAQKGKHILCEKPFALNSKEAAEMIDAAEKNHVKIMEAFMYRYSDRTRKVKEVLDSGVLGELKYINSTFRFFLNRDNTIKMASDLGGGSLYDVGCYPLNFVGMVTGKAPLSMSAEYVLQEGVDVLFSAVLKYESGLIAVINSGFNAYPRNTSEIIGTKGILEVPDTFFGSQGSITLTTDEGKKEIPVEGCDRYQLEVEDFADSIIHNRKPLLSLEETIRNMEVMERLIGMIKPE